MLFKLILPIKYACLGGGSEYDHIEILESIKKLKYIYIFC